MKNRSLFFLTRLVLLLAAWPAAVTVAQRTAKSEAVNSTEKAVSYVFVSPNMSENLALPEAIARLSSAEEKRLIGETRLVACRLHLTPLVQIAIGSWTDGAEPSMVLRVTTDEAKARYASSWLGELAQQKAVLYFRRTAHGAARMFILLLPRAGVNLAALASGLDADGIANRTLVSQGRGAVIYIIDLKNELTAKVYTAAQRLHARLSSFRGNGEFIGDDTDRNKARAVFNQEIVRYEAGHPRVRFGCSRKPRTTH